MPTPNRHILVVAIDAKESDDEPRYLIDELLREELKNETITAYDISAVAASDLHPEIAAGLAGELSETAAALRDN